MEIQENQTRTPNGQPQCPNCGSAPLRNYCPECGQKALPEELSLRHSRQLYHHYMGGGRTISTLKALAMAVVAFPLVLLAYRFILLWITLVSVIWFG